MFLDMPIPRDEAASSSFDVGLLLPAFHVETVGYDVWSLKGDQDAYNARRLEQIV
jgi:hypothetical protein